MYISAFKKKKILLMLSVDRLVFVWSEVQYSQIIICIKFIYLR